MTNSTNAPQPSPALGCEHCFGTGGMLNPETDLTEPYTFCGGIKTSPAPDVVGGATVKENLTVKFLNDAAEWFVRRAVGANEDSEVWAMRQNAVNCRQAAALIEALRNALEELENACDEIAAGRTQAVYLAMIDSGQSDALSRLDDARRRARELTGKGRVDGQSQYWPLSVLRAGSTL